ncbi:cell division protein ZipA [Colwellia sp. D2M02]|uniref:cell division protein ZipA n=1 Tax=Colwellia sp. D2M02 TaxID=2841562 RepID=UPI001C0A5BD4|nr:cell division protein ZipA [Colwellia sp. D2M02]MBU2893804.1 cell division protein ZipA [Colwellia sp. D2M02]
MEDNFRNVLIIISVLVIGAIFVHGLWTIRKQKNPYKLKATKARVEPVSRDFDGSGFDQDGVGQVTVKKQPTWQDTTNQPVENSFEEEHTSINESEALINTELDSAQNSDWFNEGPPKTFSKEELGDDLVLTQQVATSETQTEPELELAKENTKVKREPVYQQPVIKAKPSRVKPPVNKEPVKREQMEINFAEPVQETNTEQVSDTQSTVDTVSQTAEKVEPQVIVLSVVMPANQQMLGAALLPSLLTLGLKYGEMNIFHRHQDNAGNGDVTFSLANMMQPGSFDLDSMETFATAGVSLFMMLPNHGDPFVVFEQMLNAAKQLAAEFNAQILDDKRNVMTQQTEQHYMSKIREFDRLNRIASA